MIIISDNPITKRFVLKALGKRTDKSDFIVDNKSGRRITDIYNEEVKLKDFGGIRKGSEIIFKKDIVSLIGYINKNT